MKADKAAMHTRAEPSSQLRVHIICAVFASNNYVYPLTRSMPMPVALAGPQSLAGFRPAFAGDISLRNEFSVIKALQNTLIGPDGVIAFNREA